MIKKDQDLVIHLTTDEPSFFNEIVMGVMCLIGDDGAGIDQGLALVAVEAYINDMDNPRHTQRVIDLMNEQYDAGYQYVLIRYEPKEEEENNVT